MYDNSTTLGTTNSTYRYLPDRLSPSTPLVASTGSCLTMKKLILTPPTERRATQSKGQTVQVSQDQSIEAIAFAECS